MTVFSPRSRLSRLDLYRVSKFYNLFKEKQFYFFAFVALFFSFFRFRLIIFPLLLNFVKILNL